MLNNSIIGIVRALRDPFDMSEMDECEHPYMSSLVLITTARAGQNPREVANALAKYLKTPEVAKACDKIMDATKALHENRTAETMKRLSDAAESMATMITKTIAPTRYEFIHYTEGLVRSDFQHIMPEPKDGQAYIRSYVYKYPVPAHLADDPSYPFKRAECLLFADTRGLSAEEVERINRDLSKDPLRGYIAVSHQLSAATDNKEYEQLVNDSERKIAESITKHFGKNRTCYLSQIDYDLTTAYQPDATEEECEQAPIVASEETDPDKAFIRAVKDFRDDMPEA